MQLADNCNNNPEPLQISLLMPYLYGDSTGLDTGLGELH